jgi:hypothetical protein
MRRILIMALCAALAACGGGDWPDEATTQPVDCKAQPERCR